MKLWQFSFQLWEEVMDSCEVILRFVPALYYFSRSALNTITMTSSLTLHRNLSLAIKDATSKADF